MAQHTPGPWRALANLLVITSEGGDGIRTICAGESGATAAESLANAHLVAAAPALLAALETLIEAVAPLQDYRYDEDVGSAVEAAQAVIARARVED